eukprot:TRINITY_DN2270_c0_g1_i1.p3 TRINITY_DN2270_c0_g1~~TRINITY_DN2270_c0_g1_i1.p3  ORF type:complete len:104 (-),score=4.77 TRINITY_DN2270_c0_g1_i1:278-589(-)
MPKYLITSCGSFIYTYDEKLMDYKIDEQWQAKIMINWNFDIVYSRFTQLGIFILEDLALFSTNLNINLKITRQNYDQNVIRINDIVSSLNRDGIQIQVIKTSS